MGALVCWFTGLSGSGKSTVCAKVETALRGHGYRVLVLDGDDVRARLNRHLGFTPEDIRANNAGILDLCRQERARYDVILVPIISPFRDSRAQARHALGPDFAEIHFDVPVATVVARDTKGLYARAQRGEIAYMIGIDERVPYQPPLRAELVLKTDEGDPAQPAAELLGFILARLEGRKAGAATLGPRIEER